MVYILVTALVAVNIAYLFLLDRRDRRHDSQVNRLLQRVQAPEQAVLEHAAHVAPEREGPLFTNEFSDDQDALDLMLGES